MTNEAVLKLKRSEPINFTCGNAYAIEKGTLCGLADPRTLSGAATTGAFAGITRREKIASDGRTQLALFTPGGGDVFDMHAGGGTAITAGALVKLSGANTVEGGVVEADIVAGEVVGKALEDVAITTAETIEVMT